MFIWSQLAITTYLKYHKNPSDQQFDRRQEHTSFLCEPAQLGSNRCGTNRTW